MGTTKPQLFAIQNEETPAPDSGGDDPPSGEHPAREHETVEQASFEDPERSGVTDGEYREGRPRWEIAKLSEGEWRRALAHNNREIAEVRPGSPEFARLMEARHRLAFPPPAGVKYDDISKYHADQVKKELQASLARAPRPKMDTRWLLLALGFVALIAAALIFLLPELQREAGPKNQTPGAATTTAPRVGAPPTVVPAPPPTSPAPTAAAAAGTATQAPPAAASSTTGHAPRGSSQTGKPPVPSTAAPATTPTSDQSQPYFLPKPKAQ